MLNSGLSLIHNSLKRAAVFFVAIGLILTLVLSLSSVNQASAQPAAGSGLGESISTCSIQQVGWVICPVMRTIAQLADNGFGFINQNYLRIEYDLTGGGSGIYLAWELIRNIANVVLVLAFLYIVYTQITGRTTGDFNLKRILPRLIIGAILLNVSYYLCAGAIQLSNILGSAIITIMVDVADRIGTPAMALNTSSDAFKDGILTDIVTAMLQKQGTAWVMLAPMATLTIAIATVSAVALVLLIARKVVVLMLVLVSPLLFIAYLLPNLEKFFQQWVRLFIQLILLYPVVAFLLGTGQIVSATIMNVGTSGDSNYSIEGDGYASKTGGSGSATTDLAAAGAAVLPLIGVWWMMKGISAVMTTAGTRIASGGGLGRQSKERAEKIQAKFSKPPAPTNANSINIMGGKVNVFDRKPAFTRTRRRRATPGASSLPLGTGGNNRGEAGQALRPPQPQLPTSLDGMKSPGEQNPLSQAAQEAAKKMDDFNAGNISADSATASGVQAMVAEADKKKKGGANDMFKSLNQRQKPQSPDAQRQFGTAMPQAGGGQAAGPSVSSRSNDYRAPQIAHTPVAPQQVERIVAVPVQVDASMLTNRPAPNAARMGAIQPPSSELQQKAKGIANKYLYQSAQETDEAARKLDELTRKPDNNDQNPNIGR